MAYLPFIDCNGTCSRYRANTTAPPEDALNILADYGLNTVRLRLFIFPFPNNTYAGTPAVLAMARRARKAGLEISLDIFYTQWIWGPGLDGDYWRRTPEPWMNLSFPTLLQNTRDYTFDSVRQLVEQGTPPRTVQIGNEIDNGLYQPWPGHPCSQGAQVGGRRTDGQTCHGNDPTGVGNATNWDSLAAVITTGTRAVKAASPGSEIIIQLGAGIANQNAWHSRLGTFYINNFFKGITSHGAEYDSIGVSFYPQSARNASDLCILALAAKTVPKKKIYVIETGFPYQNPNPKPNQYPTSPAGQKAWLRALLYTVEHGLWGRGAGVCWWGAEYANVTGQRQQGQGRRGKPCEHEECTALWDEDFVALPILTDGGWAPTDVDEPPPGGFICPPL